MNKRVVGFFAAGFLVAAAVGGIYLAIKSGDDDRVVVAGGSLVIGSKYGLEKDPTDPYTAVHKHKNSKVTGGDIIIDGKPLPPGSWPDGTIKFQIAYCAGGCDPNAPDDLITVETDSNGKRLRATNTNSAHKLGDEAAAAPDPKTINHQPADWHVRRIRDVISNKDYPCTNGLCSIVPTYHCSWTGHCN